MTNGPAHCMPASFSAYQKYLAPFDAPPRMVARPPGPICHQPFFAQLSPSQFGEWYASATYIVDAVPLWT